VPAVSLYANNVLLFCRLPLGYTCGGQWRQLSCHLVLRVPASLAWRLGRA
jgi:hypothetical protein